MKIFRLSAMALTAAMGCAIGCGSSSSCGGSNNTNTAAPAITCGAGTIQQGTLCVPAGTNNTR
jgi:hypothetical protein